MNPTSKIRSFVKQVLAPFLGDEKGYPENEKNIMISDCSQHFEALFLDLYLELVKDFCDNKLKPEEVFRWIDSKRGSVNELILKLSIPEKKDMDALKSVKIQKIETNMHEQDENDKQMLEIEKSGILEKLWHDYLVLVSNYEKSLPFEVYSLMMISFAANLIAQGDIGANEIRRFARGAIDHGISYAHNAKVESI
ncbi:MAG: hypothetical protein H0V82_04855 [Candidatus Protochlamydia sp.]|nr:hypothetical protein [Candidatus Protochlamydia sp.]